MMHCSVLKANMASIPLLFGRKSVYEALILSMEMGFHMTRIELSVSCEYRICRTVAEEMYRATHSDDEIARKRAREVERRP